MLSFTFASPRCQCFFFLHWRLRLQRECVRKPRRIFTRQRKSHETSRRPIPSMCGRDKRSAPRTPSWMDCNTGKGARLDHLVGLGVEFTCASGAAAWVGSPFQDHARVSFAVNIGTPRPKTRSVNNREWYQKMTIKQWQGISHQIDDSLRTLAMQSQDRLKNGGGDADLERRRML
jgi:hypothetical protein